MSLNGGEREFIVPAESNIKHESLADCEFALFLYFYTYYNNPKVEGIQGVIKFEHDTHK